MPWDLLTQAPLCMEVNTGSPGHLGGGDDVVVLCRLSLWQVYGGWKAGNPPWLWPLGWIRLELASACRLIRSQTFLGSSGNGTGPLTYGPDKDLPLRDKELFKGI